MSSTSKRLHCTYREPLGLGNPEEGDPYERAFVDNEEGYALREAWPKNKHVKVMFPHKPAVHLVKSLKPQVPTTFTSWGPRELCSGVVSLPCLQKKTDSAVTLLVGSLGPQTKAPNHRHWFQLTLRWSTARVTDVYEWNIHVLSDGGRSVRAVPKLEERGDGV